MSDRGITLRSTDDALRLAQIATTSGLTAYRRPEAAAVVLLTGHELGLGPMASLRGIYEVSGRPVLAADLMVAVVRASGHCESWRVVTSTATECTITTRRKGEAEAESCTWTMEDARRAGCGGGTWQKFPRQMLSHRCAAELARRVYPDVLLGLYTPEELGAAVSADGVPAAVVVEAPPAKVSHDRVSAWWENEVSSCSTKRDIVETWCGAESGIATQPWDAREAMWQMLVARARELGFWRDAPSVAAALKADIEEHKRHDEERAAIQAEGASHYERAEALISAARSLDVLAAAWRIVVREAWPHLGPQERAALTDAKDARKAELSPKPPTGTDGPCGPSGDEPTPAAEDWTATVDGQRAHVSAKDDAHKVRASALKHGPTLGNGYVALCAQRVVALTGGEHTLESAERWCRTPIVRARKVVAA